MMAIVQFKGYGRGSEKFVNIDRVVVFEHINFNGDHGTEFSMDDGSTVRVGHWPADVVKMIEAAKRQEGEK